MLGLHALPLCHLHKGQLAGIEDIGSIKQPVGEGLGRLVKVDRTHKHHIVSDHNPRRIMVAAATALMVQIQNTLGCLQLQQGNEGAEPVLHLRQIHLVKNNQMKPIRLELRLEQQADESGCTP